MADFDAIIIGSGFGGAVLACRLGQAGKRVLVLERGREWSTGDYPSQSRTNWKWDPKDPVKECGLYHLHMFPRMAVATGAGVGGGSHVYSGVHVRATNAVLAQWPGSISRATLDPFYDKVEEMLRVSVLPDSQATPKTKLVRDAAAAMGVSDRVMPLLLSINFDPDFVPDPGADPEDLKRKSKKIKPLPGLPAKYAPGTCAHLADCNIGCPVRAKNTLDLNYLAYARVKFKVIIGARKLVRKITPIEDGYSVDFQDIATEERAAGTATATQVFVCAGSIGSTELLLRCRDQYGTLPKISKALGTKWGPNGDFLTPSLYFHRGVYPESGPVTSIAIDLRDGIPPAGAPVFLQDDGLPSLLSELLESHKPSVSEGSEFFHLLHIALRSAQKLGELRDVMVWFAQSQDASDGTFSLQRDTAGDFHLNLDWSPAASIHALNAVSALHRKATDLTGGHPAGPWPLVKSLATSHPLGGCRMAQTYADGVVNSWGEVFGHKNLFVCDGSVVPSPIIANPSHTIAALAERLADHLVGKTSALP